ncbi:unnamed protein product [Vicia faba]|uniref:Transcription factor interactor and regulator CCHC(Zn) family n=1 Tax=Vicia faba TaxID=3906 RepID=A0AAV0YU79_VICFA|nr:unnamed protein product [Vicia faba]
MMMQPLPNVDKAFPIVIQQQREMNYAASVLNPIASSTEEATTFQVNSGQINGKAPFKYKSQGGARGQNLICTHCGRNNHTVETCFLKHGYPPGFNGKGKTSSSNQSLVASIHAGSDESPPSLGFTQEQYNNILALLQ